MLAGVYPPGMKLVATWCLHDRGFGIGVLIGAITVGSALPHLVNALPVFGDPGLPHWRGVLLVPFGPTRLRAVTLRWVREHIADGGR